MYRKYNIKIQIFDMFMLFQSFWGNRIKNLTKTNRQFSMHISFFWLDKIKKYTYIGGI